MATIVIPNIIVSGLERFLNRLRAGGGRLESSAGTFDISGRSLIEWMIKNAKEIQDPSTRVYIEGSRNEYTATQKSELAQLYKAFYKLRLFRDETLLPERARADSLVISQANAHLLFQRYTPQDIHRDFALKQKLYIPLISFLNSKVGDTNNQYGSSINNASTLYYEHRPSRSHPIELRQLSGKDLNHLKSLYKAFCEIGVIKDPSIKPVSHTTIDSYHISSSDYRKLIEGLDIEKHLKVIMTGLTAYSDPKRKEAVKHTQLYPKLIKRITSVLETIDFKDSKGKKVTYEKLLMLRSGSFNLYSTTAGSYLSVRDLQARLKEAVAKMGEAINYKENITPAVAAFGHLTGNIIRPDLPYEEHFAGANKTRFMEKRSQAKAAFDQAEADFKEFVNKRETLYRELRDIHSWWTENKIPVDHSLGTSSKFYEDLMKSLRRESKDTGIAVTAQKTMQRFTIIIDILDNLEEQIAITKNTKETLKEITIPLFDEIYGLITSGKTWSEILSSPESYIKRSDLRIDLSNYVLKSGAGKYKGRSLSQLSVDDFENILNSQIYTQRFKSTSVIQQGARSIPLIAPVARKSTHALKPRSLLSVIQMYYESPQMASKRIADFERSMDNDAWKEKGQTRTERQRASIRGTGGQVLSNSLINSHIETELQRDHNNEMLIVMRQPSLHAKLKAKLRDFFVSEEEGEAKPELLHERRRQVDRIWNEFIEENKREYTRACLLHEKQILEKSYPFESAFNNKYRSMQGRWETMTWLDEIQFVTTSALMKNTEGSYTGEYSIKESLRVIRQVIPNILASDKFKQSGKSLHDFIATNTETNTKFRGSISMALARLKNWYVYGEVYKARERELQKRLLQYSNLTEEEIRTEEKAIEQEYLDPNYVRYVSQISELQQRQGDSKSQRRQIENEEQILKFLEERDEIRAVLHNPNINQSMKIILLCDAMNPVQQIRVAEIRDLYYKYISLLKSNLLDESSKGRLSTGSLFTGRIEHLDPKTTANLPNGVNGFDVIKRLRAEWVEKEFKKGWNQDIIDLSLPDGEQKLDYVFRNIKTYYADIGGVFTKEFIKQRWASFSHILLNSPEWTSKYKRTTEEEYIKKRFNELYNTDPPKKTSSDFSGLKIKRSDIIRLYGDGMAPAMVKYQQLKALHEVGYRMSSTLRSQHWSPRTRHSSGNATRIDAVSPYTHQINQKLYNTFSKILEKLDRVDKANTHEEMIERLHDVAGLIREKFHDLNTDDRKIMPLMEQVFSQRMIQGSFQHKRVLTTLYANQSNRRSGLNPADFPTYALYLKASSQASQELAGSKSVTEWVDHPSLESQEDNVLINNIREDPNDPVRKIYSLLEPKKSSQKTKRGSRSNNYRDNQVAVRVEQFVRDLNSLQTARGSVVRTLYELLEGKANILRATLPASVTSKVSSFLTPALQEQLDKEFQEQQDLRERMKRGEQVDPSLLYDVYNFLEPEPLSTWREKIDEEMAKGKTFNPFRPAQERQYRRFTEKGGGGEDFPGEYFVEKEPTYKDIHGEEKSWITRRDRFTSEQEQEDYRQKYDDPSLGSPRAKLPENTFNPDENLFYTGDASGLSSAHYIPNTDLDEEADYFMGRKDFIIPFEPFENGYWPPPKPVDVIADSEGVYSPKEYDVDAYREGRTNAAMYEKEQESKKLPPRFTIITDFRDNPEE